MTNPNPTPAPEGLLPELPAGHYLARKDKYTPTVVWRSVCGEWCNSRDMGICDPRQTGWTLTPLIEATRPVVDAGGDSQAELTLLQIEDVIRRAYQPGHLFPLGVIGWVQELIDQRDAALAAIATPPAQPAGVITNAVVAAFSAAYAREWGEGASDKEATCAGLAAAIAAQPAGVSAWIPCNERMPGDARRVLIHLGYRRIGQPAEETIAGHFENDEIWFSDGESTGWSADAASHWMPLPPPPAAITASKEGGS